MTDRTFALDGLRVLDLGTRASSAWCARLLADYGADVIGLESTPHPLRAEGPFDGQGASIPARYLLAGRRVASAADKLCADADILITTEVGGTFGAAALARACPQALVLALTPYGVAGDLAGRPGNDLTACAGSGWTFVNGLQGRPPLKSSGYQASYQTGTFAFGVLLAALLEQRANRAPGQLIDIAERDVLVSTSAPAPLRYQYSDFIWSRRAEVDVNEGPVPVADGWFALTISRPAFWRKAMEVLGLPDLAADEQLQQAGIRPKHKDRFVERVGAAMRGWTRMDLFNALGERRVIAGPVLGMDELADNPQFLARGFLRADAAGLHWPGPFANMSRSQWRVPASADTGTDSGTGQPSFAPRAPPNVQPVRRAPANSAAGPLAGVRGLVLTQAWAGTYATHLLALLGADVIQVETRGRLDSWRGTYQNPMPKNLQGLASAEHPWNCSPLYNSVNLNKRCVTIDLAEPAGVALFRKLAEQADFVAENFSPRVVGNLGIDYASLCEVRPDVIFASLSAYGATGPWSPVPGIGGTIEPSSGMSALLGYPGEHPLNSGQMYPDPVAGLCGFAAIVLALLHRDRTGQGQYIDLSMQEANFVFIGDAWLEYALTGVVRGPLGNTHPTSAPHGVYPAAGDDQWLAIAADSDAQWRALAGIFDIEVPQWAAASARKRDEAELDRRITAVTQTADKQVLAGRLAAAGVPAAAVLGPDEIVQDEQLRNRGVMQQVTHAEAGAAWQAVLPARLSRTPVGRARPAPLHGEHSQQVFAELAGVTAAQYAALVAAGISGSGASVKANVDNQA